MQYFVKTPPIEKAYFLHMGESDELSLLDLEVVKECSVVIAFFGAQCFICRY